MCGGTPEPLIVSRSRFTGNEFVSSSYSGSIAVYDSCVFEGNNTVFTSADKRITHSVFKDNRFGLSGIERTDLSHCEFSGHRIAVQGGGGIIEHCGIRNGHLGIVNERGGFAIRNCNILGNDTGIVLASNQSESGGISQNNIINKMMNLVVTGPYNILVTFNWWGSKDSSSILTKIQDGFDDARLGVAYQPYFLDSLATDATAHLIDTAAADPTIRDTVTGVVIRLDPADNPTGQVVVSEGNHAIDGLGGVKSVDIAISSDLKEKLTSAELIIEYGKEGMDNLTALDLEIYHLDGGKWESVGGTVDTVAKTVTVTVTHFSTYGLFKARNPVAVSGPIAPLRNPSRIGFSGGWITLPLQLEGMSRVSLRAEDLAGRKVAEWESVSRPGTGAMSQVFVPRRILENGLYVLSARTPRGNARILIRISP